MRLVSSCAITTNKPETGSVQKKEERKDGRKEGRKEGREKEKTDKVK